MCIAGYSIKFGFNKIHVDVLDTNNPSHVDEKRNSSRLAWRSSIWYDVLLNFILPTLVYMHSSKRFSHTYTRGSRSEMRTSLHSGLSMRWTSLTWRGWPALTEFNMTLSPTTTWQSDTLHMHQTYYLMCTGRKLYYTYIKAKNCITLV